jgi:hypothetical protein
MTPEPTTEDTMAILAASTWEAWEGRPEDSDIVPTASDYGKGFAIQLRMCLSVMHKSKPELMEIAKSMWDQPGIQDGDENLWDGFVKNIQSAKVFAECMLELADTAEARCFAAVATLAAEDGND